MRGILHQYRSCHQGNMPHPPAHFESEDWLKAAMQLAALPSGRRAARIRRPVEGRPVAAASFAALVLVLVVLVVASLAVAAADETDEGADVLDATGAARGAP